jgi:uncharacterized membrane protein YccF (DUF307 family)
MRKDHPIVELMRAMFLAWVIAHVGFPVTMQQLKAIRIAVWPFWRSARFSLFQFSSIRHRKGAFQCDR